MDTSGLESFAQTLRTELLSGVRQRLRYWGFQDDGSVEETPEEVEGGYIFRGEVHDDPGVPKKWRALKNAIDRHDLDHVAEEAAYTWFNRLVAIRILEKNGHRTDVLGYAEGTEQPAVLYRAKDGVIDVLGEDGTQDVRDAILHSDDDRAFRQLLIGVCHDSDLLNDVFGRLNDFTELLLPTGLLQPDGVVDELVTTDAISDEDYEQVELIGWLYQFYISEKKDEVYDSSGKFQPEDIPAATQIFTPHWIVRYMVENTIGRQWLDKYPDSDLREEMEYLVSGEAGRGKGEEEERAGSDGSRESTSGRRRDGSAGQAEQGEMFSDDETEDPVEPIFDDLSELELFDPAAGSGHILVVGFDLLMEMYRERGYTDREAVELVLTENLKGLEIDRRAAQLARFALLMKAAQYDRRALERDDLRPEVYALPEPRDFSTSDLRAYLGDDLFDMYGGEIQEALDLIAEHGQNVGSALKLDLSDDARDMVAQCLKKWDEKTKNGTARLDEQELHIELRGYLKFLLLLTAEYPAVAMNPPYVSKKRSMNETLDSYVSAEYPASKWDLFSVFVEVGTDRCKTDGRCAMVTRDAWMFQSSYDDFRDWLIDESGIESMVHLGAGAFVELKGEVVQATAFTLTSPRKNRKGIYHRLLEPKDSEGKRKKFLTGESVYRGVEQEKFRDVPGEVLSYWMPEVVYEIFREGKDMGGKFEIRTGIQTGDNDKFLRSWYEVSFNKLGLVFGRESAKKSEKKWFPYNKGGDFKKWYGNRVFSVDWKDDGRNIKRDKKIKFEQGKITRNNSKCWNQSMYFKESLTWSSMSTGPISVRYSPRGALFDTKGPVIQSDDGDLYHALGYLNSACANHFLSILAPSLDFNPGALKKTPYIEVGDVSTKVKSVTQEALRGARRDWDSREVSWDFAQHPLIQQHASYLEKAYNAWTEQATEEFFQLHANEEELNELFIDLYGLEDELSPRVALDDITILEDELDRDALEDLDHERDDLSDDELRQRFLEDDPDDALFKVEVPIRQFLSYGVGVMLGRYRLGHDGLHIAHPNPSSDELALYEVPVPLSGSELNGTEQFEIDDDAIVPLMGKDSPFSDDAVYRMREVVRLIWGEDTLTENLNFINHAISVGRGRGLVRDYEKTMEEWLVGDFWDWHKSLYSVPYYGKKPIYWLFQSPEGHFQVLVYMHRMDKYTPQRVRQDYLQRYQEYLRREIESLESEGEETLSGDDAKRLDTLREAAADCREYDAILKNVADQQIEIDLDDGVQNNYPTFGDAVAEL